MIHINIFTCSNGDPYYPNWDKNEYPESEYDIKTNSDADIVWDCVIVSQNVPKPIKIRCKEGNLLYISGEPPLMYPCPHSFTEQFDTVIMPHRKVKHKNKILHHGFLSWTLGRGFKSKTHRYNYYDLQNLQPNKTKLFSIVSSNQTMMPGHNKRVSIIQKLQQDYPGVVDVYGRGYKFIDFKADALLPYMFHICMENSSIPDYWTEKISDPIIAQCVPIYSGCSNLSDYLGEEGYYQFDINDYESLKRIIEKVLISPEEEYKKNKPALEMLRKHIMEKENIVPFAINYIQNSNSKVREYTIIPMTECRGYKLQLMVIRMKRAIFKSFFQLLQKFQKQ